MENQVRIAADEKQTLRADTRGAGLVEYIILVGLIALSAIAGFKTFGTNVNSKATELGTAVTGIVPSGG
jgi:Flp pilus assembly pilin Flp